MDTTVQHYEVAQLIGASISSVSRLRSGKQEPSINRMRVIKEELGWSIDDQSVRLELGDWHVEFERRIRIWSDSQLPEIDPPDTSWDVDSMPTPGSTPAAPGEVA